MFGCECLCTGRLCDVSSVNERQSGPPSNQEVQLQCNSPSVDSRGLPRLWREGQRDDTMIQVERNRESESTCGRPSAMAV